MESKKIIVLITSSVCVVLFVVCALRIFRTTPSTPETRAADWLWKTVPPWPHEFYLTKKSWRKKCDFIDLQRDNSGPEMFDHLPFIPELKTFQFSNNEKIQPQHFEKLTLVPKLSALSIDGEPLNDAEIAVLPRILNLESLAFNASKMSDKDFEILGQCHRLKTLALRNAVSVTDEELEFVKSLPELQRMTITGAANLSRNSLDHLDNHPHLILIDIYGAPALPFTEVQAFERERLRKRHEAHSP